VTAHVLYCTYPATTGALPGFVLVFLLVGVTGLLGDVFPAIPGAGTWIGFSVLNQHPSPGGTHVRGTHVHWPTSLQSGIGGGDLDKERKWELLHSLASREAFEAELAKIPELSTKSW